LDQRVSFFGWALFFIGLSLLAMAVFGLLGWRLWRASRALFADAGRAMSAITEPLQMSDSD